MFFYFNDLLKILNWTSIPVLKYINSPKIKKNNKKKKVGNCSIYSSSLLCWNVLLIYKCYICTLHVNNKPPEIDNLVAGKYNFMITKSVLVTINSPLRREKWRPLTAWICSDILKRRFTTTNLLIVFTSLPFYFSEHAYVILYRLLCPVFTPFLLLFYFEVYIRYLPSLLSTYIVFLKHIH